MAAMSIEVQATTEDRQRGRDPRVYNTVNVVNIIVNGYIFQRDCSTPEQAEALAEMVDGELAKIRIP